jgi:hypothetical protein
MTEYTYTKVVRVDQLEGEINASAITIALSLIVLFGVETKITFKADLSVGEKTILDQIVDQHVPVAPVPAAMEVVTQFEKNDKDLKLASAIGDVDGTTGIGVVFLKVPGNPSAGDGRFVAGGTAWFDTQQINDRVLVYVTDEDNIFGYGAGAILKSYTDDDCAAEFQGWRIPMRRGLVEVEPIGGYGFMPAGAYLKIIGRRDPSALPNQKFVFNVFWGKKE